MSIKKVEMFTVICDNCKKSADDGSDYSCWNDENYAKEVSMEAQYIDENGNHYCPNCYSYDEDDKLILKLLPIVELSYFGTSIDVAGHYFWILSKNRMEKSNIWFKDIPFNPEDIIKPNTEKGVVLYQEIDGYFICAISGSCYDKRFGTKSVFWTKEKISLEDFKQIIFSIPIAEKIIKQMPFEVNW